MLTPRECQVLALIARGCSDRQVAQQLGLCLGTARRHRENLQGKLDLHKSAQLTIHYLEHVAPPDEIDLIPPALSHRQREVLHLLALGRSDKQAAKALGLSDQTVRKHRHNLQRRFGAGSVCALLFAAVSGGALTLPLTPPQRAPLVLAVRPPATAYRQLRERLDKAVGGCLVL